MFIVVVREMARANQSGVYRALFDIEVRSFVLFHVVEHGSVPLSIMPTSDKGFRSIFVYSDYLQQQQSRFLEHYV